jgi:hypothetical protein
MAEDLERRVAEIDKNVSPALVFVQESHRQGHFGSTLLRNRCFRLLQLLDVGVQNSLTKFVFFRNGNFDSIKLLLLLG